MRTLTLFLILGTMLALGQNPGGRGSRQASSTPSAVTKLIDTLRDSTDPDQAVRDVRTMWETDRWFNFPKFEETAKNVAAINAVRAVRIDRWFRITGAGYSPVAPEPEDDADPVSCLVQMPCPELQILYRVPSCISVRSPTV